MNSIIKILILNLIFCLAISSNSYASGGGGIKVDYKKMKASHAPKSLVKIDNTTGYWAGMLSAMIFGDIRGPLERRERIILHQQQSQKSVRSMNAWLDSETDKAQSEEFKSAIGELTPIIIVGTQAVAAIPKKEKRIATAVEKAKNDPKYKAELEEDAGDGNVEAKEVLEVLQAENAAAEKVKLQEKAQKAAKSDAVVNKALQKYGLKGLSN